MSTFRSVAEAIASHAANTPEKLCAADPETVYSYAAFFCRMRKFAACFEKLGVKKGSRVVFEAEQTADYLAAVLSVHLLGAVFVPLERNCAADKFERICNASSAKTAVRAKEAEACLTWAQLKAQADETAPKEDYTFPEADEVSEILFSTGTTGREKGIVVQHKASVAVAGNVIGGVGIEPDNVELIPTPFNHSHALRRFYGNMIRGGAVVTLTGVMNVGLIFTLMDRHGVNSMDLVPSALSMILRFSKGKLADYADRLRYIQLGTAPLPETDKEKLKQLLPRTRLYNFYGSTESGCSLIFDFNLMDKPGCLGKPTCNTELAFVDNGAFVENPTREHPGCIATRGGMNMLCYLDDEKTTKEAFFGDYILSSDEAYLDEDGDVILLGRRDDVINVGGLKVAPTDVEEAARGFAGVEECICVAVKDEIAGNRLKLIYVSAEELDSTALRAHLAAGLEPFKVPLVYERAEKIEKTFNGKINRKAYR